MRTLPSILCLACFVPALLAACSDSDDAAAPAESGSASDTGLPAEFQAGAMAYATYCAECHGQQGEGTDQGPPHVHIVYEPNHHPDQSFYNAASIGVSSHHWEFGDMEPVEGVSDEEIDAIVGYVRWLQREAGIR